MKHLWIAGLAAALGLAIATGAVCQAPRPAAPGPWVEAQRLQAQEIAKLRSGGILAVGPDAPAIETALAGAPRANGVEAGGGVVMLADGSAQALVATVSATAKDSPWAGRAVSVVADPYPVLALLLGSYYDEVGRSADALRVLNAGLALPSEKGPLPGQTKAGLTTERGAALVALHDWPGALADYESGLALPGLGDNPHARLLRGRGFALTELGRLDEAEASYRDSLKFDPSSATAQNELAYIARLRAGGPKTATALKSIQPPSK